MSGRAAASRQYNVQAEKSQLGSDRQLLFSWTGEQQCAGSARRAWHIRQQPAWMSHGITDVLVGGGLPLQRGSSMTTDKHVDPAAAVPTGDEEEDSNLQDVPEGAVRFELEPADIEEALAAPSMQVRSPCIIWLDTIHILTLLHQCGCVHLASIAALLRAPLQSHVPFFRISMTAASKSSKA